MFYVRNTPSGKHTEPKESWPEEANLGGWKFLNADWPKKRRPEWEFYCHRKFNWWKVIEPGRIFLARLINRGVKFMCRMVYAPTND